MDSLTLFSLVFVFFAALLLYYITHQTSTQNSNLREQYRPVRTKAARESAPELPEILKQNVAVARMLQMKLHCVN